MNLSPPTKRFLQRINNYHQKVIDSFTRDEKQVFQKLCEDMELEAKDEITKSYKVDVAKKLTAMFSKEAIQNRTQTKADQKILAKYSKLNSEDIKVIKDLEKLMGVKIIDEDDLDRE